MTHPLFDMSGRVALVTGAAQGMGRATATAFAEAGADLLITDINHAGLQATAQNLEKLGRRVIPVAGDITSVDFVRAMYARLDVEFHKIDVVANVAGPAKRDKPDQISLEHLEQVLFSLVVARFCSCQEAGMRMLAVG
jgi:NAD(P)-dependent dehydrogenase (short-subunit alcohol dehydrogenase family)